LGSDLFVTDRLTPEQAAERIVADAQRALDEAADARAPRVPFYLQVKGLSALPRRKQAEMLKAAQREAYGSTPVALAGLGALLGVISGLWSWRTTGDPAAMKLWAAVLPLVSVVWLAAARRALADAVRRAMKNAGAARDS
jgi:hypothetical protein